MAIRTKPELEARINSMIDTAGTPRISAADVRSVLKDMVDSLSEGLPTFFASQSVYVADRIDITVTGVPDGEAPTRPSNIFFIAPAVLPRSSTALRLRPNNAADGPLLDLNFNPVAARQITPGMLVECLYSLQHRWTIVEPLPPRIQDYAIAVVLGENSDDEVLAAADLVTARAAFSSEARNVVDVSAAIVAAGVTASDRGRDFWLGVPVGAPDLVELSTYTNEQDARNLPPPLTRLLQSHRYTDEEPNHNGEQYKWWRSIRRWRATSPWIGFRHGSY